MTQEQKAKAYDEALKRAKKFAIDGAYASQGTIIKMIFPELAESEDEMALKGLQNFLWRIANGEMNDRGTMPSAKMCQEWIAYLEKQKEQKPSEPCECNDDALDKQLHIWFEKGRCSGRDEILQQISAEWSEEDKRALNNAIVALSMYANGEIPHLLPSQLLEDVERLKSLHPQPHTVSIKDATKFGNLEYERGVKDGIQSEKSRHWKPTEKQMKALGNAIIIAGTCSSLDAVNTALELEPLYNDLKKMGAEE